MKILGAMILAAMASTSQVDPLAPLPDAPRPAPTIVQQPMIVAQPNDAVTGYAAYKMRLMALARSAAVREATIQSVIPSLTLNSRVIELDRAQPGGTNNGNAAPPFAPYRRRHVTSDLIRRGQARYAANGQWLNYIEQRYGVEAGVLLAIYGHETSFGVVTGGFDLLEALGTLAYEGRRRKFFEEEFVAALKLLDRGTPRSMLKGSWAGATGYPQFMPSAVLRLAADGDGDGDANIWRSEADGLASIAAYFRDAGWKPNVHWGVPVRVPATLNRAAIKSKLVAPRCPQVYARHSQWKTMREWRALGVYPTGRDLPDNEMASLIEPDGPGSTAYLLTTNYRTILDYNCSNFYALSVGLLADSIVGG
ncbi:lytic murein transglycosylase [Sphingomonas sp.]|uniref:lytic murein transglycosylase n=1 Tax=Sphingomonas sp. TaxID=28214 RepID=UPI0025E626BD|nr:lytic murein transglycosylase [Sphingomonas sp.]